MAVYRVQQRVEPQWFITIADDRAPGKWVSLLEAGAFGTEASVILEAERSNKGQVRSWLSLAPSPGRSEDVTSRAFDRFQRCRLARTKPARSGQRSAGVNRSQGSLGAEADDEEAECWRVAEERVLKRHDGYVSNFSRNESFEVEGERPTGFFVHGGGPGGQTFLAHMGTNHPIDAFLSELLTDSYALLPLRGRYAAMSIIGGSWQRIDPIKPSREGLSFVEWHVCCL